MSDQIHPSVIRVINASRMLTASERLLAGEYYRLDRGHQGCYAREDIMARRVALEIRAMKTCRTRLKELGIISSAPVEGNRRRQTIHFTLPERFHPSEFAKDEEVFELAELLDDDIRNGMGVPDCTDSVGEIVKGLVQSTAPVSPPTGAVQRHNRCSPASESVQSNVTTGAVQRTPIESVLNKNVLERISTEGESVQSTAPVQPTAPIRTESSQSDVHKKNGTPNCPHPRGSPGWKSWQRERLQAGSP